MRCAKLRDKIGKKVGGKKGRYSIVRPLTPKGGMGDVFVAETTDKPKTEVVIKFAQIDDTLKLEKIHFEADCLRDFQKSKPKNIVAYVDEAKEEEEFFLVMEKLEGPDLEAKIGSKKLDEATVIKFSKDIAKALHYLHSCKDVDPPYIIHRDLKPDNMVAIKRNGEEQCILIDLGAGKKGFKKHRGSMIGTPAWSCRHNFFNPNRVDADCDIYALGRVMFYMATGLKPPDYEIADGEGLGNMQYKAERLGGVSPELSKLINDMINYPDHKEIKTAEEVIQKLNLLKPSAYQRQKIQPRKYTASPQQQLLQGPHIILGGKRWPIVGNLCEIGRSHNCPDPDFDCSRGILHADMDEEYGSKFDYPHKPDIEIPLIGSPPESVAEAHHIRIWKDKGQWYVRDLDTTNYSAVLRNGRWLPLNDGHKRKTMTLDENFTKLAIGYRSGQRTEIEFSFYKQ